MKIFDFPQYSPAWWAERRGKWTASNANKTMTAKTMKLSASAIDYACELIAERYFPGYGVVDDYVSAAMKNGIIMEPEARNFYELKTDTDVRQVGGCLSDCERFWCSPDGLIGDDGGLELKHPMGKTHVGYLLDGGLPAEYRCQVHACLIITGRKYWDFMSYSPGLPPLLVRVEPDAFTDRLREAMEEFWKMYEKACDLIATTYNDSGFRPATVEVYF